MKKNILIKNNKPLREAMLQLNRTGENCLIVVDNKKNFLWTLTDGDIRRSILKNKNYKNTIKGTYNTSPKYFFEFNFKISDIKKSMIKHKIDLMPIINKSYKVINYYTWEELFNLKQKKKVFSKPPILVVMAGGKGTRLRPFTNVLPKPLIPLGEKTIIEKIFDNFHEYGVKNFFLSVNDKALIIKSFFREIKVNYKLTYIEESKPLGTAGALKKIEKKVTKPFFMTNCDTLTNVNYVDMMNYHKKNKLTITLVATKKNYKVPYGVCEVNEDGHLSKINEKISNSFLVNVGLYILDPVIFKFIPENKSFDMTDLIKVVKKNNYQVGIYPVQESEWVDIGQWDLYKKALEKI